MDCEVESVHTTGIEVQRFARDADASSWISPSNTNILYHTQVQDGPIRVAVTRSLRPGDRDVSSTCGYVRGEDWMSTGWFSLRHFAPLEKRGLDSCTLLRELRYDLGCALQNKVLGVLVIGEAQTFMMTWTHFWTPQSGRAFMLSATVKMMHLVIANASFEKGAPNMRIS